MDSRRKKLSNGMLFTWLILAGCILLLIPQSLTGKAQLMFAHIFRWPLGTVRNLNLSAQVEYNSSAESRDISMFRNEIENLKQQLEMTQKQNDSLRGFLNSTPLPNTKLVPANITKSSAGELIINCGKKQGLAVNQFVMGDCSIIGILSEVSAYSAKVTLITSPSCRMAVKIGDYSTILQGNRSNQAKILSFLKKYKVNTGAPVFCQPKAALLANPVIVGYIKDCKTAQSPFLWDITIQPACDIASLAAVDVLVPNN